MPVSVWVEIRVNLLAWLLIALLSTLPALGLWLWVGRNRNLVPPRRTRFVPWSGFEVCLVFLLLLMPAFLFAELLKHVGFFNWLYGPGFGAAEGELVQVRRFLWGATFAFPFQLAGIVALLRVLSRTRLYQLGLTMGDAGRNLALGWLAWLLLTPPVLILNILVSWAYAIWERAPPEVHPLTRLTQGQPLGIEWFLILLSSVVIAPVLEEVIFRRVLQGWAARRPWGGPITLTAAFALTFGEGLDKIQAPGKEFSISSAVRDLEPALFVLLLVPGCFLAERLFRRWRSPPYTAQAIYSSSLLFAVFHADVWPTPVPLFVLGLVLGYLAYRTQNLIGPILFHALFNAVACGVMLLSYTGLVNGKESTSADRRPASVSASSIVPGSSLPRRT